MPCFGVSPLDNFFNLDYFCSYDACVPPGRTSQNLSSACVIFFQRECHKSAITPQVIWDTSKCFSFISVYFKTRQQGTAGSVPFQSERLRALRSARGVLTGMLSARWKQSARELLIIIDCWCRMLSRLAFAPHWPALRKGPEGASCWDLTAWETNASVKVPITCQLQSCSKKNMWWLDLIRL